jgi:hypothetical protein
MSHRPAKRVRCAIYARVCGIRSAGGSRSRSLGERFGPQSEGCSERSIRMTLSLAFLAPTIVRRPLGHTVRLMPPFFLNSQN